MRRDEEVAGGGISLERAGRQRASGCTGHKHAAAAAARRRAPLIESATQWPLLKRHLRPTSAERSASTERPGHEARCTDVTATGQDSSKPAKPSSPPTRKRPRFFNS